jgi:hypothetical protein
VLDEAGANRCQSGSHRNDKGCANGTIDHHKENFMKSKKQPVVRKASKKIADSRRVRYGSGWAPAKVVRSADAAIADSGAIRFGSGWAPASLRK